MATRTRPARRRTTPARIEALRQWYAPRRAAYPWRRRATPYRVLVSEVMLQQTQAPRVEPAFARFVRRFPSVRSLAIASRADVVRAWRGLGYNRRAVSLHEAARAIVREHRGRVPDDVDELRRLPGVGPYTAAAVASIAFGGPVALVDTNVRRVLARAALGVDAASADEAEVQRVAGRWLDRERPGDHNQALMDLGREVCRVSSPRCGECPLAPGCRFRRSGAVIERASRRQAQFEGSLRQVRGAIVRELTAREANTLTLGSLERSTGYPATRLSEALRGLVADSVVEAGPTALRGGTRGRVRLAG